MLKKLIIIIFILSPIFFVQTTQASSREDLLSVRVLKEGPKISIETMNLSYGYKTNDVESYSYILQSLDKENKIINQLKFEIYEAVNTADPDWFDPVTGEQIYVPKYNPNAPQRETMNLPFSLNIEYVVVMDKDGVEELARTHIEEHIDSSVLATLKKNQEINKRYAQKQKERQEQAEQKTLEDQKKQKQELQKQKQLQQEEAKQKIKATTMQEESKKNLGLTYVDYIFFALIPILIILGLYFWKKERE